jgi:hypothetical protein
LMTASSERHPLAFPNGIAMGRRSGALRSLHDLLQPVCPLAQGRGLGPAAGGGFQGF